MIIWMLGKLSIGYFYKVSFYGHVLYESKNGNVFTEAEYNDLVNVIKPEIRRIG